MKKGMVILAVTLLWLGHGAPGDEPMASRSVRALSQDKDAKIVVQEDVVYILHSDDDKSVPIQQALDMVQVLEKAKVPHQFVHYKDKGHISVTET
jgi:hypothetical protein